MPDVRAAVLGTGAMGCLFGGRLAPHAEVTLVGTWPEQIEALTRAPLHIHEMDGTTTQVDVAIAHADSPLNPVDVALVLTKAGRTRAAAVTIHRILKPDGLIITLQNGLNNLETITQVVKKAVTGGVTMQGASVEKPGHVRHGGDGPTYLAGSSTAADRVATVAALLRTAGLETHIVDDLSSLVWGKLAVNAGINPLTALLGVPNGTLLESTAAHSLMCEAAREVEQVAHAKGITLTYGDAAAQVEHVARLTAANRSSMLQDVTRGAATEIEAICGAVVTHGEQVKVPTPVNRMLYRLIKAKEQTQET